MHDATKNQAYSMTYLTDDGIMAGKVRKIEISSLSDSHQLVLKK